MQYTSLTRTIGMLAIGFLLTTQPCRAHDYIPGADQSIPILLTNGDLYTVTSGMLPKTDLLFENGRITKIGADLTPPDNARVIDVSGKNVYPGLIAPNTTLGLTEIGAVRATNDVAEVGRLNPDVQSFVAYNPDSEILPTVRANGITTALVVPGGSLLRGRSCLMNLDSWTREDAVELSPAGIHVSWPRLSIITAWWMEKSAKEQKKENEKNAKAIFDAFDKAKSYYTLKKADPNIEIDSRWEAMLPLFSGELSLFVHAGDLRQIEQAVHFCKDNGIRMVLVGGAESWKVADLLKEYDIPVILSATQRMPSRADDEYDIPYRLPGLLANVGVRFCLSRGGSWNARNLPFQAGQAVAFGLTKEQALRSITLSTAEILGVEANLGSLDIGKKATLFVSDGDVMDHITHKVTLMFIEGREVDLDSKQKELYRKYQTKPF
ncbi:MAG: amidohydrolase family protein [Candidatus Zixiibacteriota bacterium]